jgi:hypothetical protein
MRTATAAPSHPVRRTVNYAHFYAQIKTKIAAERKTRSN